MYCKFLLRPTLKIVRFQSPASQKNKSPGRLVKLFIIFKLNITCYFKCNLHRNCSVNLNWNNAQLYIFSERKLEEVHQLWRAKRYKVYPGKRLFWHYYLRLSFVSKIVSQISLRLFCSRDKRLLSEFLWKWGWFYEHMNVSLNVLSKN